MSNQFGTKALFRSALLMTGSTYVGFAATLITSTLIARALGPADYGRYVYLSWLSGILVLLMNNGLTTSVIRFIPECLGRKTPENAQKLHHWFINRQWLSAIAFSVLFIFALPFLKPAGWTGDLTFLAALALTAAVTKAWYLFNVSAAKGYGLFGIEAISVSALSILNLVIVALFFLTDASLNVYLMIFVGINIIHPIFAWMQLRQAGISSASGSIDDELHRRVKSHLYWTILSTFVAAFSNRSVETFLLNKMVSAEAVGFFTIAANLTRAGIEMLSTGLTTVLMPTMANAYGAGGTERAAHIMRESSRLFNFMGLMLMGIGLFWAEPLVVLVYGADYRPVAELLQIMVVIRGVTLSSGAIGALLSVTDNQRIRVAESIVAATLGAVLAIWLVPIHGLQGAIIAHATATILTFCFTIVCMRVILKVSMPYGDLLRAGTACALSLACTMGLAWFGGFSDAIQLACGALFVVLYAGATLLLRVWRKNDLMMLDKVTSRIPFMKTLPIHLQRWVRAN